MPTRPQRPREPRKPEKPAIETHTQAEFGFGPEPHTQLQKYFKSTHINPKAIEKFCFPELELIEKYIDLESDIQASRQAHEITRDWSRKHELLGDISDAQFGQIQLKNQSRNPKIYELLLGLYMSHNGLFSLRYKHNMELYSTSYTKPQIFLLTLMEHENWAVGNNHPDKLYITRLFLELEQLGAQPVTRPIKKNPEQGKLF